MSSPGKACKGFSLEGFAKAPKAASALRATKFADQSGGKREVDSTASQNVRWGFPGGAVVENLPANAGDTGSSPCLRRSHMPRSNWAREPQLLSLRIWSPCSATREAATVRGPHTVMKSGPRSPHRESPRTETKTQHSQK